jgi:hypothetical protein
VGYKAELAAGLADGEPGAPPECPHVSRFFETVNRDEIETAHYAANENNTRI